jgi:hypothetical protein
MLPGTFLTALGHLGHGKLVSTINDKAEASLRRYADRWQTRCWPRSVSERGLLGRVFNPSGDARMTVARE